MKPRLFIGSSVEGLPLAYGAQQNLRRAVEVIVWSQGVFKLSLTAIESLQSTLRTCDFGMFVFSPDDIVTIRGTANSAVRDNVIFELGMFMGLLGRERCFILLPEKHSDMRIPSDLIGINPATYESDRSDGSLEAATGPACHAMAEIIKRLGYRFERADQPEAGGQGGAASEIPSALPSLTGGPDSAATPSAQENSWVDAFLANNYETALRLLQQELSAATTDDDRAVLDGYMGIVKAQIDLSVGIAHLNDVIKRWPKHASGYARLGRLYLNRHHPELALDTVLRGTAAAGPDTELVLVEAEGLVELGRPDEAKRVLMNAITAMPQTEQLYLALADRHVEAGDVERALSVVEEAGRQSPSSVRAIRGYLKLIEKLPDVKLRLVPLHRLMELEPEKSEFYTLRGNAYLDLQLNNCAMRDYQRANELAEGKEEWIVSNIGNLLKNGGFYDEAIKTFERAIQLDPTNQYAHERLAQSIKLRDEENEKASATLKDARRELASAAAKRREQYAKEFTRTSLSDKPETAGHPKAEENAAERSGETGRGIPGTATD